MTGTARSAQDGSPAVADDRGLRDSSLVSWLTMAVSLLIVGLLTWITISAIRGGGDEENDAGDGSDSIASSSGEQTAVDEVAVTIGTEGHQIVVACFLPTATNPPLIAFASSAPVQLDLTVEATLIGSDEGRFRTVATADDLRPGEQRQSVPRTTETSTVVIDGEVVGCEIQSVQADRQVVRFG